jgi:hypothetical protein
MLATRERQARIRLVTRARVAYVEVRDRPTPERRRRFAALNRALALLALRSASRLR